MKVDAPESIDCVGKGRSVTPPLPPDNNRDLDATRCLVYALEGSMTRAVQPVACQTHTPLHRIKCIYYFVRDSVALLPHSMCMPNGAISLNLLAFTLPYYFLIQTKRKF